MSECFSARCQQDRKLIRREFNKWTKNILLQIGLETISKNHFEYDINSFNQINDEQIPIDFNPDESCLFCINRQEYNSNKKLHSNKTNFNLNEDTDDENSPLDLSLKPTNHKSDIFPNYNPEELFLSSQMNFDYLSQIYPNMNLFSSMPIDQYQTTSSSSIDDSYIAQLAKQMAYLRMIQEIEQQRNNKKSKITTNVSNTSSTSILTESMHINHVINDIMMRTLNDIFEEQIKQQQQQQTRASRQGELLFVKKQNHNNDDITIINTKKQHKHTNHINQSSSSSSISSLSSRCSPLIHTKTKLKSKSNQSSTTTTHISSRRSKEIISNNMDGKQIRPKRGQYRRYESEQLAKAVAAVLSNEMSVHKAGSYFGVPHSTLEYKVKERNSKIPTTMKNTNDLSINDNNNNNSQNDNDKLSIQSRSKSDGEEMQDNISIELEMN